MTKQKTLKLTHPDSDLVVTVLEGDEGAHLSQGWVLVEDKAKDA